jgi:hypothetical protein
LITGSDKAGSPVDRRVRLRQWSAKTARWLHLYLSMVSFGIILFFAATGLTLNHADWFSSSVRTRQVSAKLNAALLAGQPDTAAIVSTVKTQQHLHGAVDDVRVDDTSVSFTFKAPGYSADVSVDRPAGTYTLTEVRNGAVAVLNDLHKGHDAGKAWGWVIDISAVLLSLVSFTGLAILWFIYKRRTSGLIIAGIGAAVAMLLYRIYVP